MELTPKKRYIALHHPFTAPHDEDLRCWIQSQTKHAQAYDLAVSGIEAGGETSSSTRLNYRKNSWADGSQCGRSGSEVRILSFELWCASSPAALPALTGFAMILSGA